MTNTPANATACLILTATIKVKEDMVFTARTDTDTRLSDYKQALALWLAHPDIKSLVLVENSGSDISELREIANERPEKNVEFLSFKVREYDGSLGKGYGEMICLQYAIEHSQLLALSPQFVKVTGRYFLINATDFLHFADRRRDAEIICDMLLNLTWADSRVFAGTTDFLRNYLFPLRDEVNDSQQSNFEHVLARAVHACMANRGTWAEPPFPLEIQGVSGSQDRGWQMNVKDKFKLRIRHNLFARFLATAPR
ncbi:hypothetical protein [Granulicella sp. S190]|uniref:hypothetical protein n=1 Tax=Granulicella sp. S190 TaxID=1747226 RepID=UPI00131BDE7D|nr:hypothetical protein [Granulicella sp. S190]